MAKVRDMGLQIWASTPANKKLAAAAAERERIRGTAQTDNPLMKDMRSRLPLTPSVQSPTLKKDLGNLAPNYTRLTQNPNAAIAATPKPATTTPAAGSALAGKQTGTAFSGTALSNAKPVAAPNMSGGTVTDRTPVAYSSTLTQTKGSGLNPPSNTISDTKSQVLRTGLLKKGDPGWENKERYNVKNSYEYDAYDLVLEYLLSEGHADTIEEAHYVMLQMNAEHIRNIVEGFPTIQGTLNPWEDPKTGKSGIKIKSVDKSGTTKEYGPLKGGVFIKQAQTQKKPTTQVAHFEPEGEVIDERLIDKLNQKPWK